MDGYCKRCGAQLYENATSCHRCGASVLAVAYVNQTPQKKKFPIWPLIVIIAVALITAIIIVVFARGNSTHTIIDDPFLDDEPFVINVSGTEDSPVAEEDSNGEDPNDEPDEEEPVIIERGTFTDIPLIIGEGTDFPLYAIMSIPDNVTDKVPAVVLVHGDGIFDLDEEVFGNKPFLDIAEYLASHGIAVIRYDKRNFKHYHKIRSVYGGAFTARETVIEDFLLALEIIKADPHVDEDKVFLLGHSFGGYIAPRIYIEDGGFAGIISYAGTPLGYLDRAQYFEMDRIDKMPEGPRKQLEYEKQEKWLEDFRYRLENAPDEELQDEWWGEYSLYFYKDLESHPIPDYAIQATIPFIILQGSDDFAVDVVHDYAAWLEIFEGRDNVTFKLYEGLNHFFFPSQGYEFKDWEKEYSVPGHTDEQVLADTVEWIYSICR